MNHLAARQRDKDKRWDYTCKTSHGLIYPIGYCMPYNIIDPDKEGSTLIASEEYKQKVRDNKDLYHSDGHETEEEAQQCYKNYLLDEARYNSHMIDQMLRCEICREFTDLVVHVDNRTFILCEEHNNREGLNSVLNVGESWEGAE